MRASCRFITRLAILSVLSVAGSLAACSGGSGATPPSPLPDAAVVDTGLDSGSDAADASIDTHLDTGLDSGSDAADASIDTHLDTGLDSGSDAADASIDTHLDTGLDSGSDAADASIDTHLDTGLDSGSDAADTSVDSGSDVVDSGSDAADAGQDGGEAAIEAGDAGGEASLATMMIPTPPWIGDAGFAVGLVGITFDGTYAWVTSEWYDCVYKIDIVTKDIVGVYRAPPDQKGDAQVYDQHGAQFVVFDGTNIWVTNPVGTESDGASGGTVSKFVASTGAFVANYDTGSQPDSLAFDGANIWTANMHDGTVTKLRASDGQFMGTFQVGQHTTATGPRFVATDGTSSTPAQYVWVTNSGEGTITKLNASSGALVDTFIAPCDGGMSCPYAIIYDGAGYLWATNGGGSTVSKINASTGQVATYPAGNGGDGIASDGTHIWVSEQGNYGSWSTADRYLATTGEPAGTYTVGYRSQSVGYDGKGYVWVVNGGDAQRTSGLGPGADQSITFIPIN